MNRARLWAILLVSAFLLSNAQPGLSGHKKLPDLIAPTLSADSTAVIGGQLHNVAATVANQGRRAAGPFRVRFYLSSSPAISTAAIDTGAGCELAGLDRGASAPCNGDINIPATLTPGAYYLGVIADDLDQVKESNKANNTNSFGPITIKAAVTEPPPPPNGIQVDGNPDDWKGIAPLFTDDAAFLTVSVTNTNDTIYFLLDFAEAPYPGNIKIYFDTDVNPSTGCGGMELIMFTTPSEPGAHLALGNYANCQIADDYPGAVTSAMGHRDNHTYVEASILRTDLFQQNPVAEDFRFLVSLDAGPPADVRIPPTVYSMNFHYPDSAFLRIAFDPDSVPPDYSAPCGGETPGWPYAASVSEIAGVGIKILNFKTVLYNDLGQYQFTVGVQSGVDFAKSFGDCGAAGAFIGPNSTVCGRSLCASAAGRPGGQIDITISGMDDHNHYVRFTSPRLILRSSL